MPVVRGAGLYERRVSGDIPVVAGAQAELHRWRIGARGADRAEGVGDGGTIGTEGIAGVRDRLPEARARWIVVEQNGRVRLPALVPGRRTLECQPCHDPGYQGGLNPLDEEVLTVGIEENIADDTRVEE